jgi:hypothetical protein
MARSAPAFTHGPVLLRQDLVVELREIHRVGAWRASAAVKGIVDHESTWRAVLAASIQLQYEGLRLGMILTDASATEAA